MGFFQSVGRMFGITGKPIDKIVKEIGRATLYRGRPDQWGPRLAFDLAVGTVSVDSLKASVSAAAWARAIVELQRLEKQVQDAIAAMERG